jgi:hypothetical protein
VGKGGLGMAGVATEGSTELPGGMPGLGVEGCIQVSWLNEEGVIPGQEGGRA